MHKSCNDNSQVSLAVNSLQSKGQYTWKMHTHTHTTQSQRAIYLKRANAWIQPPPLVHLLPQLFLKTGSKKNSCRRPKKWFRVRETVKRYCVYTQVTWLSLGVWSDCGRSSSSKHGDHCIRGGYLPLYWWSL